MFDYLMVSTLCGNFKKIEVYFLFYVCMCVCASINTEESVGFPGAGITGSCQLPEVGVETGMPVRWSCVSSKRS